MFEPNTPVIIKGYCGLIDSFEMENITYGVPLCNIVLRDMRDPKIKIVMEDIRADEITQNPMS